MKMVKSLLLVSAAGLVAASGAQAADLPVKAKPVEYVKVCSLYGAGFYYIPGTDICMKVGGYVRYQISSGMGSSPTSGPFAGAAGWNNRINDNNITQRARAIATFDTRQQTQYGTLRTYLSLGMSQDTNAGPTTNPTTYVNRAFIQIAGFTFGKATSFFDFVSTAAVAYNAGMASAPDTGDAGQIGAWYTAQFGNGVSASVGIEQSKRVGTIWTGTTSAAGALVASPNITAAGFAAGGWAGNDNLGVAGTTAGGISSHPDIVANLRVDQAWGSAQLAGVVHDVSAGYYGAGTTAAISQINGHPNSKWGWAISPGLRLNAPMFGPGDYFQAAFVYTEGAVGYASNTPFRTAAGAGAWAISVDGANIALGTFQDAVFANSATTGGNPGGNGINLTTAWSVFASYEHFWTPALRTSLYGSWLSVKNNADGNLALCNGLIASGILHNTGGAGGPPTTTCDTKWSNWNVGSRSQWNITKDFYVGVDVMYNKLNSMKATALGGNPQVIPPAGTSGIGAVGNLFLKNNDAVVTTWRVHRDIVP